jgi:hypothetical protein
MMKLMRAVCGVALGLALMSPGVASAAMDLPDGSFKVANMAPPEPDPAPPPTIPAEPTPPEVAPDQPPAPELPPPPDVPAEIPATPPEPAADAPASGGGMGMGAVLGIVAALAVAGAAGFWFMRRK